jgi:ATP-dependent Clp protease ATP-binding subunit ClpA
LPDKAIDVIDEAGAEVSASCQVGRKRDRQVDIEEIVAKIARVRPSTCQPDDRNASAEPRPRPEGRVFGQDKAIEALAKAIKISALGPRQARRSRSAASSCSGPTGVGKTEVAASSPTARHRTAALRHVEYMERHAVSRLIGAPPGYVGFDQGGQLTEAVTKKPHSSCCCSTRSKRPTRTFNILLQVMDHGTLTDNNGRKTDFRNVIIVMTTNAGAEMLQKGSMGFTDRQPATRWPRSSACSRPSSATGSTPPSRSPRSTTRSSCAWWTSS